MTLKLYYVPGSLALAPHIALVAAGLPHELVPVNPTDKTLPGGASYETIHPLKTVPALQLDDGQVLTESTAILVYLADQAPAAQLAPPAGDFARYRLLEWLNFVAAEVHQVYMRWAIPDVQPAVLAHAVQRLAARYERADRALAAAGPYLLGAHFSVADALFFATLRWCALIGLDTAQWPALHAYQQRVAALPAVRTALAAQGLEA